MQIPILSCLCLFFVPLGGLIILPTQILPIVLQILLLYQVFRPHAIFLSLSLALLRFSPLWGVGSLS